MKKRWEIIYKAPIEYERILFGRVFKGDGVLIVKRHIKKIHKLKTYVEDANGNHRDVSLNYVMLDPRIGPELKKIINQ